MGKRKLEIAYVKDRGKRRSFFCKRFENIFKKASELGILCRAKIFMFVEDVEKQKLYLYNNPGEVNSDHIGTRKNSDVMSVMVYDPANRVFLGNDQPRKDQSSHSQTLQDQPSRSQTPQAQPKVSAHENILARMKYVSNKFDDLVSCHRGDEVNTDHINTSNISDPAAHLFRGNDQHRKDQPSQSQTPQGQLQVSADELSILSDADNGQPMDSSLDSLLESISYMARIIESQKKDGAHFVGSSLHQAMMTYIRDSIQRQERQASNLGRINQQSSRFQTPLPPQRSNMTTERRVRQAPTLGDQ